MDRAKGQHLDSHYGVQTSTQNMGTLSTLDLKTQLKLLLNSRRVSTGVQNLEFTKLLQKAWGPRLKLAHKATWLPSCGQARLLSLHSGA